MRAIWMAIGLAAATVACVAQNVATEDAAREDSGKLVREVVYNELHDHARHSYFEYWVKRDMPAGTSLEEQVETAEGPVSRLLKENGQPLTGQDAAEERARLAELRDSPAEQANRRAAYQQDQERIGTILALLSEAFVYHDEGVADGVRKLRFTPNPNYRAHGVEARVFYCLSGELWVDVRAKRLRRLEGRLDENVEFGFGLLGRVDQGSWFLMVRAPVSATDWKTKQFELHMNGRALLFKTLARNTSENRGGFTEVPPRMSLAQGLALLEDSATDQSAMALGRQVSPGSR